MGDITYRIKITKRQLEVLEKLDIDEAIVPPYQEGRRNAFEIHRRLYGIIAFFKNMNPNTRHNYYNFFIPGVNKEAVDEAKKTGWFEKFLLEEDLQIIRILYHRTQELYAIHGRGWNPRFTVTEVAQRTARKKREVRTSLDRLIGMLGFFSESYCKLLDDDKTVSVSTPYWFIPRHREAMISVLCRPKENPGQLLPEARPFQSNWVIIR